MAAFSSNSYRVTFIAIGSIHALMTQRHIRHFGNREPTIRGKETKGRWPDFFIVGAPKAGTTSLYYYLKDTSGIFMSSVKEPNFFSRYIIQSDTFDIITDEHEYLALFDKSNQYKAVGEASVCYLWDAAAPKLIKEKVPDARIIILLRDPIERAFSDYLMRAKYGGDKRSFYSELVHDFNNGEKLYGSSALYVELGMYYEQVKRYFEEFGADHVMVIIFEEFIKHKEETIEKIMSFLGVHSKVPQINEQYNRYSLPRSRLSLWAFAFVRFLRSRGIPIYKLLAIFPDSLTESFVEKYLFKPEKKPEIDEEAISFLRGKFSQDVAKLEKLLQRELPWRSVTPDK